jgi:hypothetical protein
MAEKKEFHEKVMDVETRCRVEQTEMAKAQYSMLERRSLLPGAK